MSLHKSLKAKRGLSGTRNVYKRWERIANLKEREKWADGDSLFGLPKVLTLKIVKAKKKKG